VTTGRTLWEMWVDEQCRTIRSAGRWRQITTFDPDSGVVSFASNDYLGLTRHPRVQAAAIDAIERWGTGSGASRLVVGSRPVHDELETAIARWRGCESALLFPTGYAANTGTLAALAGPGTRICSDELNHASLVDGCRLAAQRGA
jgi:8-amino-7-oxononanoate synthase